MEEKKQRTAKLHMSDGSTIVASVDFPVSKNYLNIAVLESDGDSVWNVGEKGKLGLSVIEEIEWI